MNLGSIKPIIELNSVIMLFDFLYSLFIYNGLYRPANEECITERFHLIVHCYVLLSKLFWWYTIGT